MSEPAGGEANSGAGSPPPESEPTKEPAPQGKIEEVRPPDKQPSALLPLPKQPPITGAVEEVPRRSPFSQSSEAGWLRPSERPAVPEQPAVAEDLKQTEQPTPSTPPAEIQAEAPPPIAMRPAEATSEQEGNSLGASALAVVGQRRRLQARAVQRDPEAEG